MNKAIKLAIEKGGYYLVGASADGNHWSAYDNDIVLNPLFWQALGRALGWEKRWSDTSISVWRYEAQEWFHIKMSGGDEEKFWQELLGK